MTAARHWHGYSWMGASAELRNESLRRPGPTGAPETDAFIRSTLPPLQTGHYLLRRPEAGRTWTDPDDAIAWLVANYQRHPPMEHPGGAQAYVSLDSRKVISRDGLINGVDAWWQYYTSDQGQVVFAAVCCRHSHRREIPCPMPPKS
ncbi:hypothetical protein [Actinoplanes sp. NPDC049265]|uniref:hypothetical protein n=1 Tax=Actinoplanes sp. NPDC049265 TaxID=3363902 RepID=UPI00371BC202